MAVRPSIHDEHAVETIRRREGLDPFHVRRMRHALYQARRTVAQCLEQLPARNRPTFREHFCWQRLKQIERRDAADGTSKLILQGSAEPFEAVILRPSPTRTTLCVSSQIGCAASCRFCATGQLRHVRQLTSCEIIEQVVLANRLLEEEQRQVRNVVFMGMGEPFHNLEAVAETVDRLRSPAFFHLSEKRIIVSTVGIPQSMRDWADRYPDVTLAVSLHSAVAEVREQLIPLAKMHPLRQLAEAIADCASRLSRPILIEYLMVEGLTDRPSDLVSLIDFLKPTPRVHINLIPYNTIREAPDLKRTRRPRRDAFARQLRAAGFDVTIRQSLGADIAAACGQLAVNSDEARRSEMIRTANSPDPC